MELIVTIITWVISFITGLFVYLKNPKSASNVYFGLLIFFISTYTVFNYLAVHSPSSSEALFWAKLILLVSIAQGPLLFMFAKTFPSPKFIFNFKIQAVIFIWAILNIIFTWSGLIFQSVQVVDGTVDINPGVMIFSFGLLHISSIIAGLWILFGKSRTAERRQRAQLRTIFYGILISFSMTFLITFVLPVFLTNTLWLAFSPVVLTTSVVIVAYAIVAHKLFDIRAAVTRSVAYVLVVGTMLTIYSVSLFGIINVLIPNEPEFMVLRQVLSVILIVPLAASFEKIKQFFDSLTDKVFLRDDYSIEDTIDKLGRVTVDETNLRKLTVDAQEVLYTALRPAYLAFIILTHEKDGSHYFVHKGDVNPGVSKNIDELIMLVEKTRRGINSVHEGSERRGALANIMQDLDISVITRLRAKHRQLTGFMIIGSKQNGLLYTRKDLQLLNTAADEIALAVQNAVRFQEIQAFNETLQHKVNEATFQLRKKNQELKSLDTAKDEFISMASHQLRTPLTSVKGYLSMTLDGDAGTLKPAQRKLIEEAYVSSQRMVYLIGDFLNVSRINTDKFMLELSMSKLSDIVQEEVDQLLPTAESRGAKIVYHKPQTFPVLSLDETKMRQVIMNFIDNAVYYSAQDSQIRVELTKTLTEIVFKVKDAGIGVPADERRNLFTKFYRASNARKARPDGTGIGLFMAKKVVLAHGGTIIFESVEGKGSTFGFKLPLDITK